MVFVVIRRGDGVLVWVGHDEYGGTYHRLIGGGIELGESAAAAVARELREELGADLTGVRFAGVVEDLPQPGPAAPRTGHRVPGGLC